MFAKQPRRISADLDVIPFASSTPPADLDWLLCVPCGLGLRPHQPDVQSPARLLGTCDACGRWYLILMEPGMGSALMVMLPETEAFRSAWEQHGGSDGMGERPPAAGTRATSSPLEIECPIEDGLIKVDPP